MAFITTFYPLSALNSKQFTYLYHKEEPLAKTTKLYNEGLKIHQYEILKNYKDLSLSRNTFMVLTDVKPLSSVFSNHSQKFYLGQIAGCIILSDLNGRTLTTLNNKIYVGGVGNKIILNILPTEEGYVNLKSAADDAFLQIESGYPYTISLSQEILSETEEYRRRFIVDYSKDQITFKIKTKEGWRFLSYSFVDRVVRATGLEMNHAIINPYVFHADFISSGELPYNFNPLSDEIKYFNEFDVQQNNQNVELKQIQQADVNYIFSCPSKTLSKIDKTTINIAAAKTHFNSSETYNFSK